MTAPTVDLPELNEALDRINTVLATMLDAKQFNRVPAGVRPEEMEGVIQGLRFAKALILNEGTS